LLVKYIHDSDDYKEYITFVEDRPFNDTRYFITNQKLKKLGWNVEIDFHEGLKNLVK
jgi:dTDP-D-glucose 4,6-dehydratase